MRAFNTNNTTSAHACAKTRIDQISNNLQMFILSVAIILNCTGLLAILLHKQKTSLNLILGSLSLCELVAALRALVHVVVVENSWRVSSTFKIVLFVVQKNAMLVLVLMMWIIAIDR